MPRYKVGQKVVVGLVEVTVVRGNCGSCSFYKHKGKTSCMLDRAECIEDIGFYNCFKLLKKGL